ncbi:apolipoprotein C-I isoform X2 [Alligator sinensis]|nr:apolipoprotein C-I isoform X2 [Alligator sinensis]XP_025050848.1 apolipoprotein C-I isoform X2 [Alligator sinensis]
MRPAVSIALALVALLVLADSAQSEPGEPTLMQKLEQFKENVKDFADTIGEKTKAALQELRDSEFSTKTRNWFSEHFKKVKEKLKDTFA